MSQLNEFGKTAQSLARNPLGIIALFIVLLYAIAGLVLGVSATKLESSERQPLVWFIVLFPFAVLAVFGWLVSRHHKKLYAPSDFKSDDAFLQALSPEGQRERLEKEVAELTAPSTNQLEDPHSTKEPIEEIHQRKNRIRADVVLAEDLALRQLEIELGTPIRRQVKIIHDQDRIPIDGITYDKNKISVIEVKLIRERTLRNNLTNVLAEVAFLANRLGTLDKNIRVSLVFAAVGSDLTKASIELLKSRFDSMQKGSLIPIELRLFDFAELQSQFGVSAE